MNGRTSRRSFVALATGAMASLVTGLGRVFGQVATAGADRQFDAAPTPLSDDLVTTTYTYDSQARLLSVSGPAHSVATTFRYAAGSNV